VEISKLAGHQFKRDGRWFGEVDAFASRARILLLVSCKSVIQRAEYDRGDYAAVRNARTMLEAAAKSVSELAGYFRQHRDGGSEYDFTGFDTIVGVVVTPQVMFVNERLLSQESLPALRTYSGFDEFRHWLSSTVVP
jgi:hypothetical protein